MREVKQRFGGFDGLMVGVLTETAVDMPDMRSEENVEEALSVLSLDGNGKLRLQYQLGAGPEPDFLLLVPVSSPEKR